MDPHYCIELFDRKRHNTEHFQCGIPELDSYLKEKAGQESRKSITVVYILREHPTLDIIGYYTLSAGSIEAIDLPESITRKLPKYLALPAALIGRFAVGKRYHGKQFGEHLLIDALKRSYEVSKNIGTMAVIVQAKNDDVKQFYKHYGFLESVNKPILLFLPMATVAQLVGKK